MTSPLEKHRAAMEVDDNSEWCGWETPGEANHKRLALELLALWAAAEVYADNPKDGSWERFKRTLDALNKKAGELYE